MKIAALHESTIDAPRGHRPWRRRQPVVLTAALTVALAAMWIVDGLLQLQPAQFSSGFAVGIEMNAMAQPSAIAHLELAVGRLIGSVAAPSTVLIALVQLALGATMLIRRTRRLALAASIPWALAIWAVGEGFGGVATGFAMLPTGAPGAALLYAVLAALLVFDQLSPNNDRRQRNFRFVWSTLWVVAAALQLGSRVPASLMLRANFNEISAGEPGLLAGLDHRLAALTGGHAAATTALLAFVELLLACAPWISHRRLALCATLGALMAIWVVGENLGGIFTWSASDIGITPLLALIALGGCDVQVGSRPALHCDTGRAERAGPDGWHQQRAAGARTAVFEP